MRRAWVCPSSEQSTPTIEGAFAQANSWRRAEGDVRRLIDDESLADDMLQEVSLVALGTDSGLPARRRVVSQADHKRPLLLDHIETRPHVRVGHRRRHDTNRVAQRPERRFRRPSVTKRPANSSIAAWSVVHPRLQSHPRAENRVRNRRRPASDRASRNLPSPRSRFLRRSLRALSLRRPSFPSRSCQPP